MEAKTRIPRTFVEFNDYVTTSVAHLAKGEPTTNAVRLGILPDEQKEMQGLTLEWTSLFPKFKDRYNSYTPAVRIALKKIIEKAKDFDMEHSILERIRFSPNATPEDLEVFNITRKTSAKNMNPVSRKPILDTPEVILLPINGGSIKIKCFSHETKRPSIHEKANSVQYRYVIATEPPRSVEDKVLTQEVSSKAAFLMQTGTSSYGKTLYIFFRWYNVKHPELNGPWCSMKSTLIL